MDLATAVPSTFEPLLGVAFSASLPDGRVTELVLAEVTRPAAGDDARPFQLVLRGGPTPPSEQGIVRLAHERAGAVDLFVVPATPGAEGPQYVAVLA